MRIKVYNPIQKSRFATYWTIFQTLLHSVDARAGGRALPVVRPAGQHNYFRNIIAIVVAEVEMWQRAMMAMATTTNDELPPQKNNDSSPFLLLLFLSVGTKREGKPNQTRDSALSPSLSCLPRKLTWPGRLTKIWTKIVRSTHALQMPKDFRLTLLGGAPKKPDKAFKKSRAESPTVSFDCCQSSLV